LEKGKLLDHKSGKAVIEGFGTTPGTKPTTNSEHKVSKLVSILQTNPQEIAETKKIADKKWILTAYDRTSADSESRFATNQGLAGLATDVPDHKVTQNSDNGQTNPQQSATEQGKDPYSPYTENGSLYFNLVIGGTKN